MPWDELVAHDFPAFDKDLDGISQQTTVRAVSAHPTPVLLDHENHEEYLRQLGGEPSGGFGGARHRVLVGDQIGTD
jgi:hypothetical protein